MAIIPATKAMANGNRMGTSCSNLSKNGVAALSNIRLDADDATSTHEGREWIDSGALVERVNFASGYLGDTRQPGVRAIVERLASMDGGVLSPQEIVAGCLDMVGPLEVDDETREALVSRVAEKGDTDLREDDNLGAAEGRVADLLRMIAATREYQLA